MLLHKLLENTMKSSTEKKSSSAIIYHKPKRTAMSTRTIYTRHNKPYQLGAAPAGLGSTPSHLCPAATVPADVVFACGFRCCFAEIAGEKKKVAITLLLLQKLLENTMKSSTEKQSSSAIIVHKPKRTATTTSTKHTRQNKPYRLGAASTGVVGTPTRRCPAATVPADVVFACGFPLLFC